MEKQKIIRALGFGLMIGSIIFMAYKVFKETDGDTSYIAIGLSMTVVGMGIASYGEKQES